MSLIETLSDLLNEFISAEVKTLNEQDIKHPPTIGAMFEGLTQELLNKVIFKELNLKVVRNSFIKGCHTEFDIMLVEGTGKKIPYADSYHFLPEQIIAIIQVKKNLYSKDLKEGFENLNFLYDYYKNNPPQEYIKSMLNDGFRGICRKDISSINTKNVSESEGIIYNSLFADAIMPLKIIWGYNGFKNESSFRKSFLNYINSNESTNLENLIEGYGPQDFPNLIICDKYALIKTNGMPYGKAISPDMWWVFYVSTSFSPSYYFLNIIWSGLSYKYPQFPNTIFTQSLAKFAFNELLVCKVIKKKDTLGWCITNITFDKKALDNPNVTEWAPVMLNSEQFVTINQLCLGKISLKNTDFGTYVKSSLDTSFEKFIEDLLATGLVYIDGEYLKLLTDRCECMLLPDGRMIACENKGGILKQWLKKEYPDINLQIKEW